MKSKKNILVAFDGSDSSENALKQAIQYSKNKGCEITVLTVIIPFENHEREADLGIVGNVKGIFRELGSKTLASAKALAEKEGTQVETVLGEGDIHEAIIDVAKSRDCDLIIMGRRGMTKLDRALMGSVTARVIGFSPIDILVIPDNSKIKWNTILLAVDGSKCSELAANRAIDLAQTYESDLKVLSIVDVPPEVYPEAQEVVKGMLEQTRVLLNNIEEVAGRSQVKTETFVREGYPHERIIELANTLKADVICMGSHGRTGLRRLLMGSVTEKVIGNATWPILVVKGC